MKKIIPYLSIALITLFTYLPYFENTYQHDTNWMLTENNIDAWRIGRLARALLNNLIFGKYTPTSNLLVPFITIALLILAAGLFYFWLGKQDLKPASVLTRTLVAILFVNNPIIYTQLFFKLQAVETAIAFLLVLFAGAIWLTDKIPTYLSVLTSSLLLGFACSVYESFLFAALSLALFWILILPKKRQQIMKRAGLSLFMAGILYLLSNKIFYGLNPNLKSENHSYDFFYWPQLFVKGSHSDFPYLVPSTLISGILLILFALLMVYFIHSKKSSDFIWSFLLGLSVIAFPLLSGDLNAPFRVYFGSFSIVISGLIYLWSKAVKFDKVLNKVTIGLIVLFSGLTFYLIMIQNSIFHKDQEIATVLIHDLNQQGVSQANASDFQINFYGDVTDIQALSPIEQRLSSLTTGFYSTSNFRTLASNNPSDPRISSWGIDFLNTYGYHFRAMSQENIDKNGASMTENFPNQGYLQINPTEHTVAIKLADK